VTKVDSQSLSVNVLHTGRQTKGRVEYALGILGGDLKKFYKTLKKPRRKGGKVVSNPVIINKIDGRTKANPDDPRDKPARKAATKKATKKAAAKKAVVKKPAAKKAASKKAVAKRPATKKTAVKKVAGKAKVATKSAVKKAAKKSPAKRK
jgi:hypothetical protein